MLRIHEMLSGILRWIFFNAKVQIRFKATECDWLGLNAKQKITDCQVLNHIETHLWNDVVKSALR